MRVLSALRLASAAAAAGLVMHATRSASAAWLDDVPKLYTFRLDDPASQAGTRLPLLDAFHDALVDSASSLRRYLRGLRSDPWWTLNWTGSRAVPLEVGVPQTPADAVGVAETAGFAFGGRCSRSPAPPSSENRRINLLDLDDAVVRARSPGARTAYGKTSKTPTGLEGAPFEKWAGSAKSG